MMIHRAARVDRTDADGTVFDSLAELHRWHELQLLQRTGQISCLERQPSWPLNVNGVPIVIRSERYKNGRQVRYSADFSYQENGHLIVEDSKGLWTAEARLRIAVFEALYDIRVRITGAAKMPTRSNKPHLYLKGDHHG